MRGPRSGLLLLSSFSSLLTVSAESERKLSTISIGTMSFCLTEVTTKYTVMILNFQTDRSGQTVQTQIRLLLEEQSDQGLHWLLFDLHLDDKIPSGLASLFEF